jgi:hypothetical protein
MLVTQGRWQRQNGNNRHCQRLQLILGRGRDRDGRNRNGRRIWFGTALRSLAVFAIAAARACHGRLRGGGQRRHCNGRACHQDKSQQQRDRNSCELQCHVCSFQSPLKRNDIQTIAEHVPDARILFRFSTAWYRGRAGRNLKLAAGLRLRVQSSSYEQYSCVDNHDV